MSPFSAPFSWGTQKRRLLLPKRAAALLEGTRWCKGGTGKAEDAKLQDAGISLKQSHENEWQKKGGLPDSETIGTMSLFTAKSTAEEKKKQSSRR